MNRKDNVNTLKGKVTKINCEQIPVGAFFRMTSKLSNPINFDSFTENCARFFPKKINIFTRVPSKRFQKHREKLNWNNLYQRN